MRWPNEVGGRAGYASTLRTKGQIRGPTIVAHLDTCVGSVPCMGLWQHFPFLVLPWPALPLVFLPPHTETWLHRRKCMCWSCIIFGNKATGSTGTWGLVHGKLRQAVCFRSLRDCQTPRRFFRHNSQFGCQRPESLEEWCGRPDDGVDKASQSVCNHRDVIYGTKPFQFVPHFGEVFCHATSTRGRWTLQTRWWV